MVSVADFEQGERAIFIAVMVVRACLTGGQLARFVRTRRAAET